MYRDDMKFFESNFWLCVMFLPQFEPAWWGLLSK